METVTISAKKVMFGISRNKKNRLFEIEGKEVWFPLSVVSFEDDKDQGDPLAGNGDIKGKLTVQKWIYDKKINQ